MAVNGLGKVEPDGSRAVEEQDEFMALKWSWQYMVYERRVDD
jgi:hypothetical protein